MYQREELENIRQDINELDEELARMQINNQQQGISEAEEEYEDEVSPGQPKNLGILQERSQNLQGT